MGMVAGRVDRGAPRRAFQRASIRGQLEQILCVYPFSCEKKTVKLIGITASLELHSLTFLGMSHYHQQSQCHAYHILIDHLAGKC